jgi:hypothetical protein
MASVESGGGSVANQPILHSSHHGAGHWTPVSGYRSDSTRLRQFDPSVPNMSRGIL